MNLERQITFPDSLLTEAQLDTTTRLEPKVGTRAPLSPRRGEGLRVRGGASLVRFARFDLVTSHPSPRPSPLRGERESRALSWYSYVAPVTRLNSFSHGFCSLHP